MIDNIKKWIDKKGNDYIMQEFIELEEIIVECIKDLSLVEADQLPKNIQLKGIEPSDIVNGSKYIWETEGRSILVSACLDGLIAHHDDDFWPFHDNLAGYLYGPIHKPK